MNPLTKARSGAGAAAGRVRSAAAGARDGTRRTAGWIGTGVGRGWERTRRGVGGAAADTRDRVRDTAEAAWDRTGGARLAAGARSNPRIAIAWTVAAVLLVAWIAWTGYVTAEHGANAGLGVLVAWPAVFAALALVAAPFVGAAILVRRHRNGGAPPIAGGAEVPGSSGDSDAMTGGTYPG